MELLCLRWIYGLEVNLCRAGKYFQQRLLGSLLACKSRFEWIADDVRAKVNDCSGPVDASSELSGTHDISRGFESWVIDAHLRAALWGNGHHSSQRKGQALMARSGNVLLKSVIGR